MPKLVWDAVGAREFSTGIDRGVIYPEAGLSAIVFTDDFDRVDGGLGNGWTDGSDEYSDEYNPLGIYDEHVVITDAESRPSGTTGIALAWRDAGSVAANVEVRWADDRGAFEELTYGIPLVHVTPGSGKLALGAWLGELWGKPVVSVGYIGNPPEDFELIASALAPSDIVPGFGQDIELRTDGSGVRVFVNGEQITGFGAPYDSGVFPVPAELKGSTLHGFAVDSHVTTLDDIPTTKAIDRVMITPIDEGLNQSSAVVWNGLTSVTHIEAREGTPVYFQGVKMFESVALGEHTGKITAFTYPDELEKLIGMSDLRCGVGFGNQAPRMFNLAYRTLEGDDVNGTNVHYKLHILYNVMASVSDRTYSTLSATPAPTVFEWAIRTVPEEVPGLHPTSHVELDSREVDPWLLEELEEILFGSEVLPATVPTMSELYEFIDNWYRIEVIDNGNGTWTAIEHRPGYITEDEDEFTIDSPDAVYVSDVEYTIESTESLCADQT